jgi:hypothetical protein
MFHICFRFRYLTEIRCWSKQITQLDFKKEQPGLLDFNFSIVDFPYLWRNIPLLPVYYVDLICKNLFYVWLVFKPKQAIDKQIDVTWVSTVSFIFSISQILRSLLRSILQEQSFFGQMQSDVFHSRWAVHWHTTTDYFVCLTYK